MKLTEVEDIIETASCRSCRSPRRRTVSISGGQRPAVRIHVNPLALSGVGLNLDDLRTTIANLNVNTPKGNFDGPAQASAINANDQIRDPNDYAKSIIAYRNGAPVRLSDVATVEIAPENDRLKAWMNTTPALIVNIQRQPGANVIKVVDSVKRLLPSLRESLPAAITVKPLTDRTTTIRASVEDVEFELALAVGLVVMVIFIFLRNIPATLIPSLSVPLSLIGALAIMYQAGFSLDNLSLMALTVATGFVVDDAIVVIENIARFLEQGDTPHDAAMKGSAQIGFTIISLTVSLIAVLIPLLFMGDVVGRLFHEFAITLAAAIVISAVVSLTLVPMLCAKLLRPRGHGGEASGGRFFQALTRFYASTLRVALDHQGVVLMIALGTFLLTGYLYMTIPKGFFPIQDTGVIQGVTQAAESISFDQMADHQQALAKVILADPDVASLSSFIGVDGSNITLNSGRFLINLKPHADRKATASEIIRRLQKETASVPGISLFMQPVQDLSIDTAVSATQYQFTLENQDLKTLETWTPKVLQRLSQIPSIVDVASDLQPDGRSVMVDLDRANAARFGITPAIVDNALYDAYGQRIISTIFTQSNQYRVIIDVDPTMARSLKSLEFALPAVGGDDHRPDAPAVGRQFHCPDRAAADLAPEAVSGDDDLVQPRAGRFPRRGGRRDRRGAQGDRPAAKLRGQLPGRGAGLPVSPVERGAPARGGDRGHVYRARRALRELHPSDHHPHHAAVRRHRRAIDAERRRRRARHHRRDRHRAAHRHRQEKRDHDDRFRP